MEELTGMRMNPELRKVVEDAGLLQGWIAEALAKAEADAEAKHKQVLQEKERVMRENERLKQEITMLKQAARSKARSPVA
jgi:hypothetical protein